MTSPVLFCGLSKRNSCAATLPAKLCNRTKLEQLKFLQPTSDFATESHIAKDAPALLDCQHLSPTYPSAHLTQEPPQLHLSGDPNPFKHLPSRCFQRRGTCVSLASFQNPFEFGVPCLPYPSQRHLRLTKSGTFAGSMHCCTRVGMQTGDEDRSEIPLFRPIFTKP